MGRDREVGGMPGVALSTGVLCLIIKKVPQEVMHVRSERILVFTGMKHLHSAYSAHPRKVADMSSQLALEAVTLEKL